MDLDTEVLKSKTYREALELAFDTDWDNRRCVSVAGADETFNVIVTFQFSVPMSAAKEVLATMKS